MKNQFELNCPIHGARLKRAKCRCCNALYMSAYMRQRRRRDPVAALLERARERAARLGLPFNLRRRDVVVPPVCPVLGVPLAAGSERSSGSPSLDRIRPAQGYVRGNVRVISDRANRLKGACTQEQARERAQSALPPRRPDLEKIAAYIEREELLAEAPEGRARRSCRRRMGEGGDLSGQGLRRCGLAAERSEDVIC
jgi:hypothetical protein